MGLLRCTCLLLTQSGHWPVGPLTTGLAALETPHKKYHRQGSAPGVGD